MPAPEGYTSLGVIGYTDKGTYAAGTTYNKFNVVLYNGSSYVAIKDGLTGVTPTNDGVNWRLFANGFPDNGVTTDNFQATLENYLDQTESTATNKAPSSAYLKEVKDALAEDISELNAEIITNPKGANKQEVISGSSIASDKVLLQYTIQTTNILYSGAKIYINNILFLEISSQSENLPCKFIGVLYAFKGDVIRYDANPQGGSVSVNAYIP